MLWYLDVDEKAPGGVVGGTIGGGGGEGEGEGVVEDFIMSRISSTANLRRAKQESEGVCINGVR